jgi:hypothetical protein
VKITITKDTIEQTQAELALPRTGLTMRLDTTGLTMGATG